MIIVLNKYQSLRIPGFPELYIVDNLYKNPRSEGLLIEQKVRKII